MSSGPDAPLIDLLGTTRAQIVDLLHHGARTVSELTHVTELSHEAVRRHLRELVADGLAVGRADAPVGRGRPATRYRLSARGERLYPDRSADLADDVLTFLHDERGRNEMVAFLRWRQGRQREHYAAALEQTNDLGERVSRLAQLLTDDGFLADGEAHDDGFTLTQRHCAIKDVAAAHPQLCAFEAALFREVLGARVTRRRTIAAGAPACVCTISPKHDTTNPQGARDGDHG